MVLVMLGQDYCYGCLLSYQCFDYVRTILPTILVNYIVLNYVGVYILTLTSLSPGSTVSGGKQRICWKKQNHVHIQ